MALMLPYFPSRSKEYKKIWWRTHSNKPKYFKHLTFADKLEYAKEYAKRPEVSLRNRRSTLRLSIINLLGGECVRCGVRDLRCLQLDHIDGGGSKDNKSRYRGTVQLYKYYLKHPSEANQKYQVLCANCNWVKRYENQESIHLYPYGVY